MAFPTGTFLNTNIPVGTKEKLDAGQGIVWMDFLTYASPETLPTTCVGYCKDVFISREGTKLQFMQGYPQVNVVPGMLKEVKHQFHFIGAEWDLGLFQKVLGNQDVDSSTPGQEVWGMGATPDIDPCKFLIFHRLPSGIYIWIEIWNGEGDNNFKLAFTDDDWSLKDFIFDLNLSLLDFDGEATFVRDGDGVITTDHRICRVTQINNDVFS